MTDDANRDRSGSAAHLDDLERKVGKVAELSRELRQENLLLNREIAALRFRIESLLVERKQLEGRIDDLLAERASIRQRIEEMLNDIATLEMESDSINK